MISHALAAHRSCCTNSRARCTRNSQSPWADMAQEGSGRRPEAAEPSGCGDGANAVAAAAAGKVTAHVRSQERRQWIRKSFPGFVGSLFRSALSYRQAPSSSAEPVFCTSLPGHLQNPEKWILTLAGFTDTLVKPESMRRKRRALGGVSQCRHLARAGVGSRSRPAELGAAPGGWRSQAGPRLSVPGTRLGGCLRGRAEGGLGAGGKDPRGPGRVEGPASGALPGSRWRSKVWRPGSGLGTAGSVMPRVWSGAFYLF